MTGAGIVLAAGGLEWIWEIDGWIIVTGVLCALSCALLGNFLVLRGMSMMGDAISHAVLPGLAIGFLLTGSRASLTMFVGAAVVGVLTAVFTQWVHSFGKVERGAAMGVVFTTLFALGLIMIVRAADHVDLDPGCVLYGSIELAPLDLVVLGPIPVELPRPVIVLSAVLALNLLVVIALYKELKISAFDPSLATTLGINAKFMHYLLMTLVAVTTVAAFESIGSILVIAMLIVPAAAAHLLTDRLGSMIIVSFIIATLSATLGHLAAIGLPPLLGSDSIQDTSTAGMMATVAGVIFAVVMVAAPRHGVASKLLRRGLLSFRIVKEDVLGLLYRLEEFEAREGAAAASREGDLHSLVGRATGARPMMAHAAIAGLRAGGLLSRAGQGVGAGYRLTDEGRHRAATLVRTHRLWESFLFKHLPLPEDHVHATAERLEHVTDPGLRRRLAEEMDAPTHDPHGKAIPPEAGGQGK